MSHDMASAPLECSSTAADKSAARSFGVTLNARKFSMPDRSISELLRTL